MAEQGVFQLPQNTNFSVTVLTNAGNVQNAKIYVDGVQKAAFSGHGSAANLGTKVLNSGKGTIKVTVDVNGKVSDMVSAQIILASKMNMAIVGSEDWKDKDYNDAIAILNWPIS